MMKPMPTKRLDALRNVAVLLLSLTAASCVYWTPASRGASTSAVVLSPMPMQKWDIKSCGAGALSTVLQHFGEPTSMETWDATLPKTRGGVMSIDLVLAARQKGFDASLVTGDASLVEAELRDGNPVILMIQVVQAPGKGYDFFHYVVVDGYDPTTGLFRTQFGDGKGRWTSFERLESAWAQTDHATIVIRPADPSAAALRAAVTLEEEGRYADAAAAYQNVIAQSPRSTLAWTNLGNAEMQLGNRAAAEEAFRKALEIEPDSADALNNLAWLLYVDRRIEEAEPLARKAVEAKAPDVWMRLDTLGRILAARGACEEARAAFHRAIESVPASRSEQRAEIEAAAGNCRAFSQERDVIP